MCGADTVVGADLACQSLDITLTIQQAIRTYSTSKGFRHVEYQITPRFVCLLNDPKVIFRKDVNSTQITQSHESWATTYPIILRSNLSAWGSRCLLLFAIVQVPAAPSFSHPG